MMLTGMLAKVSGMLAIASIPGHRKDEKDLEKDSLDVLTDSKKSG